MISAIFRDDSETVEILQNQHPELDEYLLLNDFLEPVILFRKIRILKYLLIRRPQVSYFYLRHIIKLFKKSNDCVKQLACSELPLINFIYAIYISDFDKMNQTLSCLTSHGESNWNNQNKDYLAHYFANLAFFQTLTLSKNSVQKIKWVLNKHFPQGDSFYQTLLKSARSIRDFKIAREIVRGHSYWDHFTICQYVINYLPPRLLFHMLKEPISVDHESLLSLAIEKQKLGMIEILLKYISHPSEKKFAQEEPNNPETLYLLIQRGCNPNKVLSLAIEWYDMTIVKSLLTEYRADIHVLNDALIRKAMRHVSKEYVILLLEHGADINAKEGAPLREAIKCNNLEMVKFLLENGTNPKIGPALQLAQQLDYQEIVDLLLIHETK